MIRQLLWLSINAIVGCKFWRVRSLSTQALADWLADPTQPPPLLLDTRTLAEYHVSHLAGARWQDPNANEFPELASLHRDTPIVAYCSVGYRSGRVAQRLQQAGFTQVYNLRGSIFQWANEGRSLTAGADCQPTRVVHPYNRFWGQLLKPELQAPEAIAP